MRSVPANVAVGKIRLERRCRSDSATTLPGSRCASAGVADASTATAFSEEADEEVCGEGAWDALAGEGS